MHGDFGTAVPGPCCLSKKACRLRRLTWAIVLGLPGLSVLASAGVAFAAPNGGGALQPPLPRTDNGEVRQQGPTTLVRRANHSGLRISNNVEATSNHLVKVELHEGAIALPNLLDLEGVTLRFVPGTNGYALSQQALAWESDFGTAVTGTTHIEAGFDFPFAGTTWSTFYVNALGSLTFGQSDAVLHEGTRFS